MAYLGDFAEDTAVLNFKFNTRDTDGAPITLASGAVSVYKMGSATQRAEAGALTADYDSVTGLHDVTLDLSSDAFYEVGKDYQIYLSAGTVDSISVVGTVLAQFSIENRFNAAADALGTPVALDSGTATIAGMLTKIADDNGGADFDAGTDSLQEMRDASVTAATVADAVWDEASTGHVDAGKAGAQVWTNLDAVLADTGTDGVRIADAALGGSSAVLTLKRLIVANTTNDQTAVDISASGTGNSHALNISATGGGKGVAVGAVSNGVSVDSSGADAIAIASSGGNGDAVQLTPNGTGVALNATVTAAVASIANNAITAASLNADAGTEIAAAVGALVVEGTTTVKQSLQLSNALAAGKLDGAATTTIHLRDLADSKNRITATVDSSGNREAVSTSPD